MHLFGKVVVADGAPGFLRDAIFGGRFHTLVVASRTVGYHEGTTCGDEGTCTGVQHSH